MHKLILCIKRQSRSGIFEHVIEGSFANGRGLFLIFTCTSLLRLFTGRLQNGRLHGIWYVFKVKKGIMWKDRTIHIFVDSAKRPCSRRGCRPQLCVHLKCYRTIEVRSTATREDIPCSGSTLKLEFGACAREEEGGIHGECSPNSNSILMNRKSFWSYVITFTSNCHPNGKRLEKCFNHELWLFSPE